MMMMLAGCSPPHRADRELEQIGRVQPGCRGLSPKHHPIARLLCPGAPFRGHQNGELLQIHNPEVRTTVVDGSQPGERIHGRRGYPGDVGPIGPEPRALRQPRGREDQLIALPATRGDCHGEWTGDMAELYSARDPGGCRRGDQLDAIEIPARPRR
jgi:hypothetical protein